MAGARHTYHRRPEWEEHEYAILAWPGAKVPYYESVPEALNAATSDVSAIAEAVAKFEPVKLLVDTERLEEARKRFPPEYFRDHPIEIHAIEDSQLDLWMRDIAPVFTVEKSLDGGQDTIQGVNFNFNGWGGKVMTKTNASLAKAVLSDLNIGQVASTITAEGGAIEVDGEGTLIASESSLVNDNRNAGKSRENIEEELSRTLGINKFLWVSDIKRCDTTDFHIDAVARFAKPGLILFSSPQADDEDDWAQAHRQAREILSNETDAKGRPLEIIDIMEPQVEDVVGDETILEEMMADKARGYRWVFSYVNYLIVNGGVVFPQFGAKEADAHALKIAREVFADRQVVPVMVRELGIFGGGIHCATQEMPLVKA